MSEVLDELAQGVGKAIETVPTVYDDALKPTTQESGKILALIPRTINAALVPLRQWIANREYNLAETEKLLAKKLEHVSEDKIVTPEPYTAVPAIQALSYSMNSEELRNLYANLLAKAMNSDTKDMVHPAYVSIITQMTPLDAQVLQFLLNQPDQDMPLIDLVASRKLQGNIISYVPLQTNITSISFSTVEAISLSLDNLSRNNLIHISDQENTDGYNSILVSEHYKKLYKKHERNLPKIYPDLSIMKKNCTLSALGKSFCDICVS